MNEMVIWMWTAPGNIFFSGEHAVVYGRPAIVASVDLRTRVNVKQRDDNLIIVNSKDLGMAEMMINGENKQGEETLLPVLNLMDSLVTRSGARSGFEINIESDIPVASGMSSSTAVSSAILGALNEFLNLGIERSGYFDILHRFQTEVHGGKASGSEIYSSVFGGFNYLENKNGNLVAENLGDFPISVVIADTRVKAPTKLTVGYHVPSLMDRYPEMVENAFDEIKGITIKIKKAIKDKNVEKLGALMDQNQGILEDLYLSHPKLDDCINEARKAGALGAKLSGGGWGGIMFALVREEDINDVASALEKTGARVIKTRIGVKGLRKE